jgi:hypothetical protein
MSLVYTANRQLIKFLQLFSNTVPRTGEYLFYSVLDYVVRLIDVLVKLFVVIK